MKGGKMAKRHKFWNKEDAVSDKVSKVLTIIMSVLTFVMLIGFGGVVAYNNWFRTSSGGTIIIKASSETSTSERYEISSINDSYTSMNLSVVLEDNKGQNKTIDIGQFGFDYIKSTVYFNPENPTQNSATVIYYLPDSWFLNQTQGEAQYIVIDKRKQEVRGDPVFYKGRDYPESLILDSIAIEVDAVKIYQYEEYNETAYNFVFSASENNTDYDIVDFRISAENIMKGVHP